MEIIVSKEYSKNPGGRYIKEGKYSGEDFRNRILKPKFEEALKNGEALTVNLDGGYGYGSSFLEEAFGGLARELKNPQIAEIEIISEEEPGLVKDIESYIVNALRDDK